MRILRVFLLVALILVASYQPVNADWPDTSGIEVYVNHSSNLLELSGSVDEYNFTIPNFVDINMIINLGNPYNNYENDNLSVHYINVNIHFLSEIDIRNSCMSCAVFTYSNTEDDSNFDVYQASISSDGVGYGDYEGIIQIDIIMENATQEIIWNSWIKLLVFSVSETEDSETTIKAKENNITFLLFSGIILGLFLLAYKNRASKNVESYSLPKSNEEYIDSPYENHSPEPKLKQTKVSRKVKIEKNTGNEDKFKKLKDLENMYKEGLIDKDEFIKLKNEIIN